MSDDGASDAGCSQDGEHDVKLEARTDAGKTITMMLSSLPLSNKQEKPLCSQLMVFCSFVHLTHTALSVSTVGARMVPSDQQRDQLHRQRGEDTAGE